MLEPEQSVSQFCSKAETLSQSEYGIPLDVLVSSLEQENVRFMYGRLLGIMVKEPFSDRVARSEPSHATGARFDWYWNYEKARDYTTQTTWQFALLRHLVAEHKEIPEPSPADVFQFIQYEGCVESRIFMYVIQAAHTNICGDAVARSRIQDAVKEAQKQGANIVDLSPTNLPIVVATAVSAIVASFGSYAILLGPIAGGLALMLARIGLDAFCIWAHDEVKLIRDHEKSVELKKLMSEYRGSHEPFGEDEIDDKTDQE